MNVAIWLLTAVLALPLAEIVVFVVVAAVVGFVWAALALIATSLIGSAMLRFSGGAHIARIRGVIGEERVAALKADNAGTMYLIAAILLLIPGFITDAIAVLLLIPPLRRLAGALLLRSFLTRQGKRTEGVVDLDRDEWQQVPEARLRDQRERDRER
jgi:UPF0716 protein FxsA